VEFVVALYDNEPDDSDELGFSAGERIEVVKKDDSGFIWIIDKISLDYVIGWLV